MNAYEGLKCTPIRYSTYANYSGYNAGTKMKPICQTFIEDQINTGIFLNLIYKGEILNSCPSSCKQSQYKGKAEFLKGYIVDDNLVEITYSFPTTKVQVYQEYLMFGLVDLIGTIGGHSGLFIGFSFYGVITQFIEGLKKILCKVVN